MKKKLLLILLIIICIITGIKLEQEHTSSKAASINSIDNVVGLSKVWKSVSDLYCYFEYLPGDMNWDKEYEEAATRIAAVENEYEYFLEMNRFMANLEDGHVAVTSPNISDIVYQLSIETLYIEGKYYIIGTPNDSIVPLLSEIIKIEGIDTKQYLEKNIEEYVGIQTPLAREDSVMRFFTDFGNKNKEVTITILTPNGDEKDINFKYDRRRINKGLEFDWMNKDNILYASENLVLREFTESGKTIHLLSVYTLMGDLRDEYINNCLPHIKTGEGCIIDLRNGGGGNTLNGMTLFYPFVDDNVIETAAKTKSSSQIKYTEDMILANIVRQEEDYKRLGLGEISDDLINSLSEESIERGMLMFENKYTTNANDEFTRLFLEAYNNIESNNEDWSEWFEGSPKIDVPVVALINHNSGSAIDSLAATIKSWGIETVGTHTRGNTGDLSMVFLPNDFIVTFSTRNVLDVDGSQIFNKGVEAKHQIDYKIEDLINGKDTILEKGIEILIGL